MVVQSSRLLRAMARGEAPLSGGPRQPGNNLLSQPWTWEAGDISANPTYGNDFEAALRAIKARTIIVPVDDDR
jgi:hypothetical protein